MNYPVAYYPPSTDQREALEREIEIFRGMQRGYVRLVESGAALLRALFPTKLSGEHLDVFAAALVNVLTTPLELSIQNMGEQITSLAAQGSRNAAQLPWLVERRDELQEHVDRFNEMAGSFAADEMPKGLQNWVKLCGETMLSPMRSELRRIEAEISSLTDGLGAGAGLDSLQGVPE